MAAMAFLITIILGYPYLNYLRRAGLGKKVRIDGPSTHIEKTGTPTMGGLLVTVVVLALTVFGVAYASFSRQSMVGYWEILAPVIGLLCVVIGWPHAHDRTMRLRLICQSLPTFLKSSS